MYTGPGGAHQVSAIRVFGRVWKWNGPCLRSKPGPLAGNLDPLLTPATDGFVPVGWILWAIMMWMLSIFFSWASGYKERKSVSRRQNASLHSIIHMINVSHVTHALCCTSWIQLWRDPEPAIFPGRRRKVDGNHSGGNKCLVDMINEWSIFHYYLSYTIEGCPVNEIQNVRCCKSKLGLLNSSQHLNWSWGELWTHLMNIWRASKPVLGQLTVQYNPDLGR
jgi:hypothetical protein